MAAHDSQEIAQLYYDLAMICLAESNIPLFSRAMDRIDEWLENATEAGINILYSPEREPLVAVNEQVLVQYNVYSRAHSYITYKTIDRLLDWFEQTEEPRFMEAARNAADFSHGCRGFYYVSRQGREVYVDQDISQRMSRL